MIDVRKYLTPRIGVIAAAVCGVVLVASAPALVRDLVLGDGQTYAAGYADALITAHTRHKVELEHVRDSLTVEASKARIVYVARRGNWREAVAALPAASIVGDTLTIPAGVFVVPHPVAEYIGGLRLAVAKADTALTAGDTALAKTVEEAHAEHAVAAEADTITTLVVAKAEASRPGFLARVWDKVKVPVAVVGGFLGGVAVARVIP